MGTDLNQVGFTLRLTEVGPAGLACTLFVPVEAYGQGAELVGDLNAGAVVLVTGKLKWTSYTARDNSKKTSLAVLARVIKMLAPAPVETTT
jgi:single-stranded DNA-binding protein